jgi:hypothetical protein
MVNPDLRFDLNVLQTLERLAIPYVVIGAFAGTSYGINRATYDVDIVVDLNEEHIEALAKAYPPPRYYADPYQMRDSIRLGILFNIIDSSEGLKIDLIPLTMKPGYKFALDNRIRRLVPIDLHTTTEVWLARPEDIIVGKLFAWNEGRSYKHETDIRDILTAVHIGLDPEISQEFNVHYIDRWAQAISTDVADFWNKLKQAVQFKPSEDL